MIICKEKKKSKKIHIELSKGLSINQKEVKGKVTFYEKKMVKALLKKKFKQKYKILIKHLYFYLSTDDDSGTAIREALNEVQKFQEELKTKYRKILKQKELEQVSKELKLMEKEVLRKLYLLNHYQEYLNENVQNKGK